jgi:hypothetical protein
MRKQHIIQLIDIIIVFNIVVFIAGGISSLNVQNQLITITFFIIGLFNFLFLLMTIKLRNDYNKKFVKKLELEVKSEEVIQKESRDTFNVLKQKQLEARVESILRDKIPNAKIIKNAYIPSSNGSSSEIDVLMICELGIFIIECKNITGEVIANWKSDEITINHPGGKSYKMQNPINQNTEHFKRLRNILGMKNDYFRSIVVFGDLSYIKNFKDVPYHAMICHLDGLMRAVDKLAKRFEKGHMEFHLVETTYNSLYEEIKKTDKKAENHIQRLEEKYYKEIE